MENRYKCIVMGAAGRDFHVYLSFLKSHPEFRVLAFTATQIPFIDERGFPQSLAGPDYDSDIPIYDESELPRLIRENDIDFVFFQFGDGVGIVRSARYQRIKKDFRQPVFTQYASDFLG